MATLHEKLKLKGDQVTLIIKQNTCNLSVEFSPLSRLLSFPYLNQPGFFILHSLGMRYQSASEEFKSEI